MKQRISIINKSTGKFKLETINGREHLVTSMMVIEGDSVMNGIFYPNSAVSNAMGQLDMLPAPDGHPSLDGAPVSAFHPLAVNAHNFGGFTRSPTQNAKRIITDLVIDLDIANKSERGKKIIAKIKKGERIGVSTGLIAELNSAEGKVGEQEFFSKVMSINFDHVAVLLDAAPAGENTFTINHGDIKPKKRGMFMDELTLDLTSLAVADRIKLSELKVNELLNHVNHTVTVDEAKVIVENAGLHFYAIPSEKVEEFIANEAAFKAFKVTQSTKLNETKEFILANSKMTSEQLNAMEPEALESIAKSVAPKNTYIGNGEIQDDNSLELLDDERLEA